MSILLTVVTRTTTENPAFCVVKANQERWRANQLRNVKLNRQFLALKQRTLAKEISMKAFEFKLY